MSIHKHHKAGRGDAVWLTPPHILAALGPFDLDPCAAPEPRPWATANRMIALPEDGLAAEWEGRVWLNPPYDQIAWQWMRRLGDHGRGTALLFARTETDGFHTHVWRRATALRFLSGRLHFHNAAGERAPANAGAPSVLCAYGAEDAYRLETCGLGGAFMRLNQAVAA